MSDASDNVPQNRIEPIQAGSPITAAFLNKTVEAVNQLRAGVDPPKPKEKPQNSPSTAATVYAASVKNVASLSGSPSSGDFDGVTPPNSSIVLLKDQTTASQNGRWKINTSGAWTRASGATKAGMVVAVRRGDTQAGQLWVLQTEDPITVGTTSQTWAQRASLSATVYAASIRNISSLSGSPSSTDFDGQTVPNGAEVLLKDQTSASQNGLYTMNTSGSWTRSTKQPIVSGMAVSIRRGTKQAGSVWILQTEAPITVGTTGQTWVREPNQSDFYAVRAAQSSGVPTGTVDSVSLSAGDLVATVTGASKGVYRYNGSTCVLIATPMAFVVGAEGSSFKRRLYVKNGSSDYAELYAGVLA